MYRYQALFYHSYSIALQAIRKGIFFLIIYHLPHFFLNMVPIYFANNMMQNMHINPYYIIKGISLSILHNELCLDVFTTSRILCVKLRQGLFVKVWPITVTYSDTTELRSCSDTSQIRYEIIPLRELRAFTLDYLHYRRTGRDNV